ncbi:hypothetical protein DFH09DRAFT_1367183, partial [Mycena vulgaris]
STPSVRLSSCHPIQQAVSHLQPYKHNDFRPPPHRPCARRRVHGNARHRFPSSRPLWP